MNTMYLKDKTGSLHVYSESQPSTKCLQAHWYAQCITQHFHTSGPQSTSGTQDFNELYKFLSQAHVAVLLENFFKAFYAISPSGI